MHYTRNEFLKLAALSGASVLTATPRTSDAGALAYPQPGPVMTLGLASYTLRNLKLDEVIKVAQRLGLESLSLKSVHLPLESSASEIKEKVQSISQAGIKLYGAGVIYMKTAPEVEAAFNYAREAALEMIIGVPNHDLLPLVNEQVKKNNIKLAIHNHGPGDTLYTSPTDVYEKIKDLDKRIGLCMDVGHVVRIGQDPIPMIAKFKDRLYDMHIKDETKAVPDGQPTEIGRGVIDIPGILKALKKVGYTGHLAIEYEKSGDDPVPGLAESVGYLRGVLKMIN